MSLRNLPVQPFGEYATKGCTVALLPNSGRRTLGSPLHARLRRRFSRWNGRCDWLAGNDVEKASAISALMKLGLVPERCQRTGGKAQVALAAHSVADKRHCLFPAFDEAVEFFKEPSGDYFAQAFGFLLFFGSEGLLVEFDG